MIRNNEFKNYKIRPGNQRTRVKVLLRIGIDESIQRVEEILQRESPGIHETLCRIDPSVQGPNYVDVEQIVYIACFCMGQYHVAIYRRLQRELKLMCERNGIRIPVQRIDISQSGGREEPSLRETADTFNFPMRKEE